MSLRRSRSEGLVFTSVIFSGVCGEGDPSLRLKCGYAQDDRTYMGKGAVGRDWWSVISYEATVECAVDEF